MKKFTYSAFVAGVLGLALSAHAFESSSEWFSLDFDGDGYELSAANGWTQEEGDTSALATEFNASENPAAAPDGTVLKLETDGNTLVYTPEAEAQAGACNIVEMDVYLVAADEIPTAVANAQTEVYLDGETGLMGLVDGAWVDLDGDTGTEAGWHHLAIRMDYANGKIFFQLDGATVGSSDGYSMGETEKTKIESLGFQGTGFVDNFVGTNLEVFAFDIDDDDEGDDEVLDPYNPIVKDPVTGDLTITFKAEKSAGGSEPAQALKFIKVYSDETTFKVQRVTEPEERAVTVKNPFRVEAFYGADAAVITEENKEEYKPEPSTEIDTETGAVTVKIPNAKSGVYYGLFVDDGEGEAQVGESILVGMSEDGQDKAFPAILAPTQHWGVKKIRVRAMDTPTHQTPAP